MQARPACPAEIMVRFLDGIGQPRAGVAPNRAAEGQVNLEHSLGSVDLDLVVHTPDGDVVPLDKTELPVLKAQDPDPEILALKIMMYVVVLQTLIHLPGYFDHRIAALAEKV
jgi:hypothetical protein